MAGQCQDCPSFLLSSFSTTLRIWLSSMSSQPGYSANTFISTFQAGKRKEPGVRDNVHIRKVTLAQKPLRRLLLKLHWPEPNHMAIDSCRRGQSNCSDSPNFELEAVTAWGCLCREQGKNGSHIATGRICLILHL